MGTPPPEPPAPKSLEEANEELRKVREELRKANREAAERRKKLAAYEDDEKRRAEAALTEAQKQARLLEEYQTRAMKAEADLADLRLRFLVEREASKLHFHNPEDAYQLADLAGVEIGEDGKATGIDAALKALAKERPYLVKSVGPTGAGLGTPSRPGPQMGQQPAGVVPRPVQPL